VEVTGTGRTLATRTTVVVIVLFCAIIAQGSYLWSFSLTLWLGPGHSPTFEQGLLISRVTSGVFVFLAAATVVLARAVPLGIVIGVWALLLFMNAGLWLVIVLPGLIVFLIAGVVPLVRERRRADTVL
jgi:hypothetical protein